MFDEVYDWHYHPASDELFIVVSGCLAIDLEDNRELRLHPWQCVTIPAKTLHRTRALGRTVSLVSKRLAQRLSLSTRPSISSADLLCFSRTPREETLVKAAHALGLAFASPNRSTSARILLRTRVP